MPLAWGRLAPWQLQRQPRRRHIAVDRNHAAKGPQVPANAPRSLTPKQQHPLVETQQGLAVSGLGAGGATEAHLTP